MNQFAEFNRYTNTPVANYKGEIYNLPFNMNTFNKLWGVVTPAEAEAKIAEQRAVLGGKTPENLEEQAISLVGTDIYEKLIKSYTEKQWEKPCTELPAFIIRRLPVRLTYDNNYFNDTYQGIPIGGYTQIVEKMLEHENIDVETNVDFFANKEDYLATYPKIVFTGMIDEFLITNLVNWNIVAFNLRQKYWIWKTIKGMRLSTTQIARHRLLESSNTNISNLVHNRKPLLPVSTRRPNEVMSRTIQ